MTVVEIRLPPYSAIIVACPVLTPLIVPLSTVTIAEFELLQFAIDVTSCELSGDLNVSWRTRAPPKCRDVRLMW